MLRQATVRRALIALLMILDCAVVRAETSAIEVIRQCVAAASDEAVGLTELDEECPGLESALVAAGFSPFLSDPQADGLTSYALGNLLQLHERYQQKHTDVRELQVDGVADIVRSLQQPGAQQAESLLQRLERWLREFAERRQSTDSSWLSRWLQGRSVPQRITNLIGYGLMALVVALTLAVLTNELRAAGVLKRSARQGRLFTPTSGDAHVPKTFDDVNAAAAHDQPSLLLQLVVSALTAAGRLSTERSLTHRELIAHALLDVPEQRERFRMLAVSAERTRYGGESLESAALRELLTQARQLHEEILTGAGGAR